FGGGRTGERASKGITEQLVELGFESGRMKTGTPPRVDGRSLNYDLMEEQKGDDDPQKFSYSTKTKPLTQQKSCFITYTNTEVHSILEEGFEKSPMFTGRIQGLGPRYCPSIEDKINRFSERNRHQIFVEPEGWNTVEMYINGFSTSLPEDIQIKALRKIKGFENAKMFRPGYAIEYDYFPPTQLHISLETKLIENLYFAGQINGTTGYEEAACQGLMAGINAHRKINSLEVFKLSRNEAYIGVLIDDLINKGTDEPYRMFTSRAEFRILLRQDNADLRLTEKGIEIGLARNEQLERMFYKKEKTKNLTTYLLNTKTDKTELNTVLEANNSAPVKEKPTLLNILKRPEITLDILSQINDDIKEQINSYETEFREQTEIQLKYEDYIEKQEQAAQKVKTLEDLKIHPDFNYEKVLAISTEARQKLTKIKPDTIGQASRISGVSPSDISVLLVYLGR
ncbi:MAG: tRNA uridine-5-carboxymethylaminomethyl(34) synthesis enzyme MnmG, partial [Cyclobacteriaceae bacterium]|nr:tRNA uridine-5-carboxymethylaminomethyl(34) synthesis enzyme MnmG [Cyclobacteriaceae bacterium]